MLVLNRACPAGRYLTRRDAGSALFLSWRSFPVLLPGRLPPEQLPTENLTNLCLIALEKRDLAEIHLVEWLGFRAQVVIGRIKIPSEAAESNWLKTYPGG